MVEIIPKETELPPLLHRILYYSSIVVFIFLLAISLFFLLYNAKLEKRYAQLNKAIIEGQSAQFKSLEAEVLSWERKIDIFSKILPAHKLNSKVFKFLEENTHPKVYFKNLQIDTKSNKINLDGVAENFIVLNHQETIFQKNSLVKEVFLSNISYTPESKISFNLKIELVPALFLW